MFTGLVQSVGTIAGIEARPQSKRLRIAAALREDDRILGASVAVSGVCLTVVDATAELFEVDAAFETLARTTLGDLRVGDRVNLEPALRIGDALGGHLVSGHVDGVGRLRSRSARGDAILMWFDVPTELRRYVAEKGSICVDGVSLTVNAIDGAGFSVGLIPHTLSVTTLGDRRPGDPINLEVDLIARYVERLLAGGAAPAAGGGVNWSTLAEAGFGGR
ncbi:MAG: riboflavin synthase [Myxococcales bacterium]|nr:riboflavin synthase [Myxococcales bacterium]